MSIQNFAIAEKIEKEDLTIFKQNEDPNTLKKLTKNLPARQTFEKELLETAKTGKCIRIYVYADKGSKSPTVYEADFEENPQGLDDFTFEIIAL